MTALTALRIDEICAHRDRALSLAEQAAELRERAHELMTEAQAEAGLAHAGHNWIDAIGRREHAEMDALLAGLNTSAALAGYRQSIDAGVLKRLYMATGAWDMLDAKAKEAFLAELTAGRVPEVNVESLTVTFEIVAREMVTNFREGLARTFSQLDRRFKSHDGFKVGSRIIILRAIDGHGFLNRYGAWAAIVDVERCFALLDGAKPCPGELEHQLRQERQTLRGPHQSVHETRYFRIRVFKNGNAHLWMRRDDLVEKVNLELAAHYGPVLADAVPADAPVVETSTALAKDLSFYATPAPVVERLLRTPIRRIAKDGAPARVLEPSAGEGHIVGELLKAGHTVDAIEVHAGRARRLMSHAVTAGELSVRTVNFLALPPHDDYDAVVMNPPFWRTHWMQHIRHAFKFLRPGGVLLAVLPVTADVGDSNAHRAFRAWAEPFKLAWSRLFEDLPTNSFASSGTRINTVILRMRRPMVQNKDR